MSVYNHPSKPGWQMIKLFRGREKPEYIPFQGTREQAQIFERELKGIADHSNPSFCDKLPEFKIAYANEVMDSTFCDFEWAWKKIEPFFKSFTLAQITPFLIESYKAYRLETVSKRTINRELSYLSKYLQYCGAAIKVIKFRKKDCQGAPPKVLNVELISQIIDKLDPPIRYLVQLMAYNGLRKSEAFKICSVDASEDGSNIMVRGKGGKWRIAPISLPELKKAIATAKKANPEGFLFPNPATDEPYIDIRKSLKSAAIKAGINQRIYNHLMRHSFATALVPTQNIAVIQSLLGHADISMTQKYIHLADDNLRQATATLITPLNSAKKTTKKRATKTL